METFLNQSDILFFKLDSTGSLNFCSSNWEQLLGWRKEDLLERHITEIIPKDRIQSFNHMLLEILVEKQTRYLTIPLRSFEGEFSTFNLKLWRIKEKEAKIAGTALPLFSLSSHKETVKRPSDEKISLLSDLTEQENSIQFTLLDGLAASVMVMDAQGFIKKVNPFCTQYILVNHTPEGLIGKHLLEIDFPEEVPIKGFLKRLIKGDPFLLISQGYPPLYENGPSLLYHIQGIVIPDRYTKNQTGSLLLHYPENMISLNLSFPYRIVEEVDLKIDLASEE